jgi:hypothetical protein
VVIFQYRVQPPTVERRGKPGWFLSAALKQTLVARSTRYLMHDVARERGMDPSLFHDNWEILKKNPDSDDAKWVASGGVFVCDFNRDGILDVLVTDINRFALYKGTPGGRFVDVTAEVGLPVIPKNENAISNAACFIDIDGDGWDDLILGGRVYQNVADGNGGRRFQEVKNAQLPLPPDTVSLVVADFDKDGRLDVYATRTAPMRKSWLDGFAEADKAGNRLLRNVGNWKFQDVTAAANASGGPRSCFTAAWLDANNDGWPDLHVINEFGNGVLLINQKDGTFREHLLGEGPLDYGSMGVAVGDINNDGWIDIYCANMFSKAGRRVISNMPPEGQGGYPKEVMKTIERFVGGSQLHLNRGGGRFEQAGERLAVNAVGWAYGPVLADLDNDGWLDIHGLAGHLSRDRNKPDG